MDVNGVPTGWFHVALTLRGEDLVVYYNTIAAAAHSTSHHCLEASDRVVIGKRYVNRDLFWGNVKVDELAMWNRALSGAEVAQIYDISFD